MYSQHSYITCSGKEDGVGAQVHAILSTMLFAKKRGFVYVHTPFRKIEHNDQQDPNWEHNWEHFFNLGLGELHLKDIEDDLLEVKHLERSFPQQFQPNVLYVFEHCHFFADRFVNHYKDITSSSIAKFRASSVQQSLQQSLQSSLQPRHSLYQTNKLNVAVHIRAGDVTKNGAESARYTHREYYKCLIESICNMTEKLGLEASIHVYSQGSASDFEELASLNLIYHLNESVFTTFYNMTCADILIMSKSSFSYSAALLSNSVKIYEPFWHPPLDEWIATNWSAGEVHFDRLRLERDLLARLSNSATI